MKNYKDVINMRYNREEISVYDNIYSALNPTGFYMKYKTEKVFCELFKKLNDLGSDFTEAKILDIGCGKGNFLRFVSELKQSSNMLYGVDLSEVRIAQAKSINPNIKYFIDDIVNMKDYNMDFDIITALDVFMHLNTEEQIVKALENVNINLKDNGIFIWYDGFWESHFEPLENADSCGFNPKEMEHYAKLAGFEKVFETSVFKYLYNQVENSTAYMGSKHPIWYLELMEENSPGIPVNLIMVFKKVTKKVGNTINDSSNNDSMDAMKIQFKNNIQMLINDGKLDDAKNLLEEYKKIITQDIEIYSMESVIEIMKGNFDDAAEIIKEGLIIESNNVDLLYNYAYIQELNSNIEEALKYYRFAYRSADENLKINIKEYIKGLIQSSKLNKSLDDCIKEDIDDKKSKKILILCNFYSPYLKGYIENIKERYNIDFDVATASLESEITIKDNEYYKFLKPGTINNIYTFKYLGELEDFINNMEPYDIIHIHYLQPDYSYIVNGLKNKCDVLVTTIWGSDFYRTSNEEKQVQKDLIDKCDIITFDNEITMDEFISYYGEYLKSKCTINRFGLTALEYINKLDNSNKNDIKEMLGIPEKSIVVQCGYNAKPEHNHLSMIDSIVSVKDKLPQNMFYVFPMTYGKEENYFRQVKNKLENSGINYMIIEDFMQFEDIANLTKCTDIMVHLQTTDTLSATMQEHLYNGNIIITGSWLPYKPFKDIGTYFIEIPCVENLGGSLVDVVNNLEEKKIRSLINKKVIWEFSSWEATAQKWIENYEVSMEKLEIRNTKKKVLVIAYFFPPLGGAGVQRTLKYVKYLREFGWEPIVLTVSNSNYSVKDESLNYEIPEGIKVIRIDDFIQNELTEDLLNELIEMYSLVVNNNDLMNEYVNMLNSSQENFEKNICIPDIYSLWALKCLKRIDNLFDIENIDLIYSTSAPYSDHIIAYYLKKKYNKPWVADFRDEWTNNPYLETDKSSLKFKIERAMEGNIVEYCDSFMIPAKVAGDNYKKNFGIKDSKITIITNGYDEEDFEDIDMVSDNTSKFRIIHNGFLYLPRTTETFFKAVRNLIDKKLISKDEIEIYFTRAENCYPVEHFSKLFDLDDIVKKLGYLTHKESLILCNKMNVLLLIIGSGEKQKTVYTGKVFEYLRLAKPILALAPKSGVVDELLKETNSGKTVEYNNVNDIEETILHYYEKWKNGNDNDNTMSEKIRYYSRKNLTGKLAETFDSLVIGKNNIAEIIDNISMEIKLGNFQLAEETIKKNLMIEYNSYQLLYSLGKLYIKMIRYNEALDVFNIAKRVCTEKGILDDINNKIIYLEDILEINRPKALNKDEKEIKIISEKLQSESFEYKIMKMLRHNSVETLITGLSYYDVGLIEEEFNSTTVNIALSGQDLHYDYLVFKHLIENYKSFGNLKNIIIGLSYYSFNYDLSKTDSRICRHRYINYIKDEHNDNEDLRLINDIYLTKFSIYDDINKRRDKLLSKICDLNNEYKEYLLYEGKKQSKMSYPSSIEKNIEHLKNMLDIAKEKGVRPILLISPVTNDYSSLFTNSSLKQEFYLIIEKLNKEYDFIFYDYFNDENFSNDDFYDYAHLNKQGAIKFSKMISSKI